METNEKKNTKMKVRGRKTEEGFAAKNPPNPKAAKKGNILLLLSLLFGVDVVCAAKGRCKDSVNTT